jgi:uncharacterized membrane protein
MKKLEHFVIEVLAGLVCAAIIVGMGMWWLILAGGTVG